MSKARFISFASVISELRQSDLFMTVKARILETPKANLNGASVTEAFVDDIIANEERYVGLPLYADIRALKSGKYNRLGHLYDARTGEFHSTQIGSFYQFEKEDFEGGSYLIGYARIPKRDKALSKAIAELFAEGALKFSFEITCVDYDKLDDGTIVIDASENNFLEGTAIVTFPACEDAVALEFVAQREADDTRKGDEEMAEVEKLVAEETEATEASEEEVQVSEVTAEAETEETHIEAEEAEAQEPVSETAEEKPSEEPEDAEEETACKDKENACKDKENACKDKENAAVYVHETHTETHGVCAYDPETGKDVCQTVTIETRVSEPVEGNLVEADDGITIAEAGDGDPGETNPENPVTPEEPSGDTPGQNSGQNTNNESSGGSGSEEPASQEAEPAAEAPVLPGETKKTAEEMIAELSAVVKELAEEVKSLKGQRVTASQKVTAEVNPFTDTITLTGHKYSLLEPETKREHYTLI